MKIKPELNYKILDAVERMPPSSSPFDLAINEHADEEVSYHIYQLSEAGLLKAVNTSTMGHYHYMVQALTPLGHGRLEDVRAMLQEGEVPKLAIA